MASTLCKYDLRKCDLFVLSWAWGRRVRWGGISSEPQMGGKGVLPLVVRCIETIDVSIWRMFVFMSVVVTVWGGGGVYICCVAAVVKDSGFSSWSVEVCSMFM